MASAPVWDRISYYPVDNQTITPGGSKSNNKAYTKIRTSQEIIDKEPGGRDNIIEPAAAKYIGPLTRRHSSMSSMPEENPCLCKKCLCCC